MTSGRKPSVDEVVDLISQVLCAESDRLAHTLAVGRRAGFVANRLGIVRSDTAVVAAYLHDVGYAEAAGATGMHQLDGARFLRSLGYGDDVCRLVAHHTFARVEARNRGLDATLEAEFPLPDADLADLLDVITFADLTTSNTGRPTTVADRFAGIFARYAPDHVVAVTMREVEPFALDVVDRVQALVDAATVTRKQLQRNRRLLP